MAQGQRYWRNVTSSAGGAEANPVVNMRESGYGPGTAAPIVEVDSKGVITVDLAWLDLYDQESEFRLNRGAARWLACRLLEAAAISEIATSDG